MKKIFALALIVPLSGCSWFMDKSFGDFILDDILGCDGVRNQWPCTADYIGDNRTDFLSDPSDRERPNEESDSRESEHEHEKNGEY